MVYKVNPSKRDPQTGTPKLEQPPSACARERVEVHYSSGAVPSLPRTSRKHTTAMQCPCPHPCPQKNRRSPGCFQASRFFGIRGKEHKNPRSPRPEVFSSFEVLGFGEKFPRFTQENSKGPSVPWLCRRPSGAAPAAKCTWGRAQRSEVRLPPSRFVRSSRVQGSGFRAQGSGLRAQGSG